MNTGLEQKARQNKQNSENNPSFKQSPDFQKYNWCDTETKDRLKSYGYTHTASTFTLVHSQVSS